MSIISKLSQLLDFPKSPLRHKRRYERTQSSPAPPAKHSSAIQESKKEQAELAMIGNVKVLLYLNQKTVALLRSNGVEWPEAHAFSWLRTALEANLKYSPDGATLSTVSKVRCQSGIIYRDKGGGICVLFEGIERRNQIE